jgi:phosphatidylserine decarboxylase
LALKKRLAILSENKRVVTEIDTEGFGTMLYVEIGATFVGSIHQTYTPNRRVQKGEEKGYFEFGGSCLALLFERGRIAFDKDLIHNTQNGLETRINFGESLAKSLT